MNTLRDMLQYGTLTEEEVCLLGLRALGFDSNEAQDVLDTVKVNAQHTPEQATEASVYLLPPGPRPRWTKADDAKLKRLYKAGVPVELIAAELGRSVSSIHGRVHRMRLPKRGRTVKQA